VSIHEYEQAAYSIGGPGTALIRVGSAVLFRAGTAALRVTGPDTPAGACAGEAALAGWLADHGVPTIAVSAVHRVGAFTVMVMAWLDAVAQATGAQAGALAAACHQAAAPAWLRRFDPLAVTVTRVRSPRSRAPPHWASWR